MPYDEIVPHFLGTDAGSIERQDHGRGSRARLASYCLKDCVLVLLLLEKKMAVQNAFAFARFTHMTLGRFMGNKVQVLVYNTEIRYAIEQHYFVPYVTTEPILNAGNLTGGYVFDVLRGYYDIVATLDFASLYPNIIRGHNLCPMTLLPKAPHPLPPGLTDADVEEAPDGNRYVRPHILVGATPRNLTHVLNLRAELRKAGKEAMQLGSNLAFYIFFLFFY